MRIVTVTVNYNINGVQIFTSLDKSRDDLITMECSHPDNVKMILNEVLNALNLHELSGQETRLEVVNEDKHLIIDAW